MFHTTLKRDMLANLDDSNMSGVETHILDNTPLHITSILCKSGFCAVLHLRANYILVSFSEYHPDKHYTWLPFPAVQCNPALQNKEKGRRKKGKGDSMKRKKVYTCCDQPPPKKTTKKLYGRNVETYRDLIKRERERERERVSDLVRNMWCSEG